MKISFENIVEKILTFIEQNSNQKKSELFLKQTAFFL